MPIFRIKSVKIYTGQKNLHWRRQRQLSGMQTFTKNPKLRLKPDSYLPLVTQTETRIYFPPADATCGLDWTNIIFLLISWDQTGLISRALREPQWKWTDTASNCAEYFLKLGRIFPQSGQNIAQNGCSPSLAKTHTSIWRDTNDHSMNFGYIVKFRIKLWSIFHISESHATFPGGKRTSANIRIACPWSE